MRNAPVMTGSYFEKSGKKLPNDWKSYLRMRASSWGCEIDQNKNYSGDSISSCRTSRSSLPESYGDIGKLSFNVYSCTNLNHSEPRFPPTKSAFNAWVSSAHPNPSPKFMTVKDNPRMSYSPIRNRFSTRYLPGRCHLDTRYEPNLPSLAGKYIATSEQSRSEVTPSFAWSKSHTGQTEGGAARARVRTLNRHQSPGPHATIRELKHDRFDSESEDGPEVLAQEMANQNRSADRSKSHSRIRAPLQPINNFWWEAAKTSGRVSAPFRGVSHRLTYSPEAGDGGKVGSQTSRHFDCKESSFSGAGSTTCSSAGSHERVQPWSPQKHYLAKSSETDKNASRPKPPDARTVEIERQLIAARKKIRQECTGFNLRPTQATKKSFARGVKKKNLVPYEPLYQTHQGRATTEDSTICYISPTLNNKTCGSFNPYYRSSNTFLRSAVNNTYTSLNLNNGWTDCPRSVRYPQNVSASRTGENGQARGQRLEGAKSQTASVSVSPTRVVQSATACSAKRRCKSAMTTAKSNVTSNAKTVTKRKSRRRRGAPQRDVSGNGESNRTPPVSKRTISRSSGSTKEEKPHSAVNRGTAKAESPVHTTSSDLKAKRKVVGSSTRKSATRLRRKESTFEESGKGGKPIIDDCDSLVRREKTPPQQTHHLDMENRYQNNAPKMYATEYGPQEESREDYRSPKPETLLTGPLIKLEEARKKLRALLQAGTKSPALSTMPAVIKATNTTGTAYISKPLEDSGEGGLFPPQHNYDRFLWTDDPIMPTEDVGQSHSQHASNRNSDALQENMPTVKGDQPSLPATTAENKPVLQRSLSTPQLEKFPKKKAHAAIMHQPSYLRLKPDRRVKSTTMMDSPRENVAKRDHSEPDMSICRSTYDSASREENALRYKTGPPYTSVSEEVAPKDVKSFGKKEVGSGEAPGVRGTQSSRDNESAKTLHPPPTAAPPRKKKLKVKRKKLKSSTQDKGVAGVVRRGAGSSRFQPKTYHQLGLAPLVRSPSSENTFHFAIDLGSMQGVPRRRRKRKSNRGSKKKVF